MQGASRRLIALLMDLERVSGAGVELRVRITQGSELGVRGITQRRPAVDPFSQGTLGIA